MCKPFTSPNSRVCRRAKSYRDWLTKGHIWLRNRRFTAPCTGTNCRTIAGGVIVRKPPPSHYATKPNQVWMWDITWIPGPVKGLFFYLYLILDLYSRKVVAWEVWNEESAERASQLVRRAILSEQCAVRKEPLVLHSDTGSPMKGATLLETLCSLGITPSRSRPRVSNDNPYAESIFRTCKYRPEYPARGFESEEAAREWVLRFVHGYNTEHRHSGLKFLTPNQRHQGMANEIFAKRHAIYEQAKANHPNRCSGNTRDWSIEETVWLNPERTTVIQVEPNQIY